MRVVDVTDFSRTYRTAKEGEFPEELWIHLRKESDLRYGENPNQPGAVYRFDEDWVTRFFNFMSGIPGKKSIAEFTEIKVIKSGGKGLSVINYMDVARALEILKFFEKPSALVMGEEKTSSPSAAVMKHLIPCGFATQHNGNSLERTYVIARDTDPRSAYGSAVVLNRPIDKATAEAILSTYVEVVAAPSYEEGVLGMLNRKDDLRAVVYSNLDKLPKFVGDDTEGLYDLKVLPAGKVIVQAPYLSSIRNFEEDLVIPLVRKKDGVNEIEYVVKRHPTKEQLEDMKIAWYVLLGVRSNGIVIVKDGATLSVGSGEQERVGALEQAIVKGYQKAMDREKIQYDPLEGALGREKLSKNPLEDSALSSDAFFPFRDSIDLFARVGGRAIIQPGGSKRDYEVIQAVNEHDMAMAFTLERCFGHF